jgi:hypothetical protein
MELQKLILDKSSELSIMQINLDELERARVMAYGESQEFKVGSGLV